MDDEIKKRVLRIIETTKIENHNFRASIHRPTDCLFYTIRQFDKIRYKIRKTNYKIEMKRHINIK